MVLTLVADDLETTETLLAGVGLLDGSDIAVSPELRGDDDEGFDEDFGDDDIEDEDDDFDDDDDDEDDEFEAEDEEEF